MKSERRHPALIHILNFLPDIVLSFDPTTQKTATSLEGEIVEDEGGATALVKLDNRSRPIPIHKGMLFAPKYSDAWKVLHKTTRDFTEFTKDCSTDLQTPEDKPISSRLRKRVNTNTNASSARKFYNLRKQSK